MESDHSCRKTLPSYPFRTVSLVSPEYIDYGHTPPGEGPRGARDDYEHAVELAGGVLVCDIDALVARGDTVAVPWAGPLPNGSNYRGLSLYRVIDGRVPGDAPGSDRFNTGLTRPQKRKLGLLSFRQRRHP